MQIALVTSSALPHGPNDDAPLHDALRARGMDVHTPAWNDGSVRWERFDACVIRSTWDYQENLPAFLAWAERVDRLTPLFNPLEVLRWNTHKSYLRTLAERGVPTVPTAWLAAGSSADVHALLRERAWDRCVLKPAVGATARETIRFDRSEAACAQAHVERLLPHEDLLLQPFLERVEQDGELSGIFVDGVLVHAVRKVPAAGDFRVQDDFGAHDEPHLLRPEERDAMQCALAAAGLDTLYARADFMWDGAGHLRLGELELVEPLLFFRHAPESIPRMADAIVRRMRPRVGIA